MKSLNQKDKCFGLIQLARSGELGKKNYSVTNALGFKAFRQGFSTYFQSSEPTEIVYFIRWHSTDKGLCTH